MMKETDPVSTIYWGSRIWVVIRELESIRAHADSEESATLAVKRDCQRDRVRLVERNRLVFRSASRVSGQNGSRLFSAFQERLSSQETDFGQIAFGIFDLCRAPVVLGSASSGV